MELQEILGNDKLPIADRLVALNRALVTKIEAGEGLSDEERQAIVVLAEEGITTKVMNYGGSDAASRAANRMLEPQQFAAMSVARTLATTDAPGAENPFGQSQLQGAYKSERAFE